MKGWQVLALGAALVAIGGNMTNEETTAPGGDRVKRIAEAIAVAEGFGRVGAIPTVRNNPGNIRDNSLPGAPIGTYASLAAGWAALYRQVGGMLGGSGLYPRGWSLEQVAQRYTGEARYMDWAVNVARVLGVSTKIIFSEIQ